jgi:hypothetical protein
VKAIPVGGQTAVALAWTKASLSASFPATKYTAAKAVSEPSSCQEALFSATRPKGSLPTAPTSPTASAG